MTATLVFTGPESTGKTVLSNALRAELATFPSAALVPEFARLFYERRIRESGGPDYRVDDLVDIARGQRERELVAVESGAHLVLLDTDIVSTQVYAAHYYGNELPRSIELELQAIRAASSTREYVLCGIDWPWSADPLRDREFQREQIYRSFERALDGETVHLLFGSYAERLDTLRQLVGVY